MSMKLNQVGFGKQAVWVNGIKLLRSAASQEFPFSMKSNLRTNSIFFCSQCRCTHTHILSHAHHHTPCISFQFQIHCSAVPSNYDSTEPCWSCRQSYLSVESSCALLPSHCAAGSPRACCLEQEFASSPLLLLRSPWFRLTPFLAPPAEQRACVNSILEPLSMLVLALIVCALSLCLADSLRFGVWKRARWPSLPRHHCLFFIFLFPLFALAVCVCL